jgi:uncharacterized protein YcaQ
MERGQELPSGGSPRLDARSFPERSSTRGKRALQWRAVMMTLSSAQARSLALGAQGFGRLEPFGLGHAGTLRAIEHLGYVQIDTVSVVERAHHHVLWSRVPDYRPEMLDGLLAERSLYEYWSHAAAYLPMRDFRFSLPRMKSFRGKFHWSDDSPELRQAMRRVISRIRRDGALRARDFESKTSSPPGFWTFTKIEKRALHELWMRGDILVAAREGFQKSYDLADRVLPAGLDRSVPTEAETADFLIASALRAHGIVRDGEISYLRGGSMAAAVRRRMAAAARRGWLTKVAVEGMAKPAYVLTQTLEEPPGEIDPEEVRILSPFDNLVIQRERVRWLFGFDYQIECYVPEARRRYGHFVLPVLWGDRFAARLEAKAVRSESRLVVKGLWFEAGFEKNRTFRRRLKAALERFAVFNGCGKLDAPLS